jgi:FMN reductase
VVSVAVVVGNPKAGSRTLRVATTAAAALTRPPDSPPASPPVALVVDLAEVAGELFDPASVKVQGLLADVASSDLVVVASPTYKATYTGLLKSFLDRYGSGGLAGTVGVAVMTGAAPIHALAPEVHLRPLLVELGATVPSRALYVTEDQFEDLDAVIAAWAADARPLIKWAVAGPEARALPDN